MVLISTGTLLSEPHPFRVSWPTKRGQSLTSNEKLLAAVLRLVEVSADALHGWGVDELDVRDIPQGVEPFQHLWMDEKTFLLT